MNSQKIQMLWFILNASCHLEEDSKWTKKSSHHFFLVK